MFRKKDESCAVIVNSCDAFEDTWDPFFKLFSVFWKECPYAVYINTETKKFGLSFDYDGFHDIHPIQHDSCLSWSSRLIHTLHSIKSRYVIILLDDFFLNDYVDQERVSQCIEWMEKDRTISAFSFASSKWSDIDDHRFLGFELRPLYGEYRFNLQAGLWNRKDLLRILRRGETPWEAENMGTFRARVLMPNKKFYAADKSSSKVFSYEYGGAIHRGKWTLSTPLLLERYNIHDIDYSKRGFDDIPTEEWARLQLGEIIETPEKSLKIRIGELLVALGVLGRKSKQNR